MVSQAGSKPYFR